MTDNSYTKLLDERIEVCKKLISLENVMNNYDVKTLVTAVKHTPMDNNLRYWLIKDLEKLLI